MAKNRRGGKNNRKVATPALKDLDPATLKVLAKEVAVQLHALQAGQPTAPSPSTDLVPVKDSLPAVVENRVKRSRPALVFLGLVEGGLKTVKGGLKLAQSTFCKDVENDWMKNNVEALLATGITLTLQFVRPDRGLENVAEGVMGAKLVGQSLGKLVITSLNSALGWSQKKIEKYEAAIEVMKFKSLAKPSDASFIDVASTPEAAPVKVELASPSMPDNLRMFPPPKPDQTKAQVVQQVKPKTISARNG